MNPKVSIEKEGEMFAVYIQHETSSRGETKRWHVRTTPDYAGACAIAWAKACSATDKTGGVVCENVGVSD